MVSYYTKSPCGGSCHERVSSTPNPKIFRYTVGTLPYSSKTI